MAVHFKYFVSNFTKSNCEMKIFKDVQLVANIIVSSKISHYLLKMVRKQPIRD